MEFLLGILCSACLVEGYLLVKKKPVKAKKVSKEEVEEQKRREAHFDSLMNFDAEKAYGGKK